MPGDGEGGGGKVTAAARRGAPERRPATPEDEAFCWALRRSAMRDVVAATWGWDEADQHARFKRAFSTDGLEILSVAGEAIGALRLHAVDDAVTVSMFEILPRMQRLGYGTAVLMQVLEAAGETPVLLQVLKVNPARALYERLGFRAVGETATHVQLRHDARADRG